MRVERGCVCVYFVRDRAESACEHHVCRLSRLVVPTLSLNSDALLRLGPLYLLYGIFQSHSHVNRARCGSHISQSQHTFLLACIKQEREGERLRGRDADGV